MNRDSQFTVKQRLMIYVNALELVSAGNGDQFRPICGALSVSVMKFIPVDHSWSFEIEWDFPELWASHPPDAESQETGKVWWPFNQEGFDNRINALRTAIESVKKILS